jgi:hypothetical protein
MRKSAELQSKIVRLCKWSDETIVKEKQVAAAKKLDSSYTLAATSDSDATIILLQKELYNNLECLFVFVLRPEVFATNNISEREFRSESQPANAVKQANPNVVPNDAV